ncbi:MAG TPA: JDVT-CTERM system glutamic-type intramembrane protease [Burkholderiaceae bacterium]|nr:JDVT-CTERM system glutamic-type intramembrane protease [Burkholderiaceae bacterium]
MAVACLGGSMLPLDAVLVNLLLAPWLEELLFREGLQRLLTERLPAGPLPALLTALAFTAAHLALRPDLLSLATFAPACLLGLLYARRQDLTLCICTHSAMNLAWLALIAPALAGSPSLH